MANIINQGLAMTQLQRTIIIVAAFGIVSLVLTQTQTDERVSAHDAAKDGAQKAFVHINSNNINANIALIDNQQTPIAEASLGDVVTNIYQTQSGSFYFIESGTVDTQFIQSNLSTTSASPSFNKDPPAQPRYRASTLLSTQADIRITGPIARTRLTQVFKNDSDVTRSGIYVFPLPKDAAVDHLLMTTDGRVIEGEIKRKDIAKKMFTQAKAQGKKASLIAQIRPNIFSNQIANIPAHSEVSVTIEYQQFITQDQHNYALRLPLSITPRYTPIYGLNSDTMAAENTHFPALAMAKALPVNTTIKVTINAGLPLSNITSEHHPITIVNTYDTEYQIVLDTLALGAAQPANKDFVLNWQMKTSYSIQASHFTYQSKDYEYGLITLMPPAPDQLKAKRNLIFILDVSGSMVGESIEQAKQSLALAIEDLSVDDYFNLIAFSSDATRMWSQSQKASENAKNEALTFIYGLEANGGTEIKTALDMAFAMPTISEQASSYLNQILFITDGSVSNEDELMRTIYEGLGDYRLFTVGIGSAPNAYFMAEAANAGKGTFTFIGDTNKVKPKMARLLNKLKKPALTNLHLNIKDAKQAFGFEIYPSHLPDLYADEPLVISYRQPIVNKTQSESVPFSLRGEYLSLTASGHLQTRKWTSQLPTINAGKELGIHKYWARLKIKDLHHQLNMRVPFNDDAEKIQTNIKEAIIGVALSHHLISKFTSLIAIEHINPDHLTQLAANSPNNDLRLSQYQQAQLPQTATSSGLMTLIGSILICFSLLILRKRNRFKHAVDGL